MAANAFTDSLVGRVWLRVEARVVEPVWILVEDSVADPIWEAIVIRVRIHVQEKVGLDV